MDSFLIGFLVGMPLGAIAGWAFLALLSAAIDALHDDTYEVES